MGIDVRRGTGRFVTRRDGDVTHHSFSSGEHYDRDNVGFGPLVAHDDHQLTPGGGFAAHRHTDVEIVTWVVSGALRHDGSSLLFPGHAAVQSAGDGVTHSEEAAGVRTRFVQAWLVPDRPGGAPTRSVAALETVPGSVTPVVGPGAPLQVGVSGAALDLVPLDLGQAATLPPATMRHVFVVSGSVGWGEVTLRGGDAVRTVGEHVLTVVAEEPALLLAWRFDGPRGGRGAGRR